MITLIPKTVGLFDPVILHRNYQLNFPIGGARTATVKLLDGTTYIHDVDGYVQGDREARVTIENLTSAQRLNLETMIASRADILFGTDSAQFSARVASIYEPAGDQAEIKLQITSKDADISEMIYP